MSGIDRPETAVSDKSSTQRQAQRLTVIEASSVTPAVKPLPEVPFKAGVEALLQCPPRRLFDELDTTSTPIRRPVEACSDYRGQLVSDVCFHPVVAAVHLAFMDHRPLVLSPDMLWLMIAQGFANHVNAHSEQLRTRLVRHSGKVEIRVRRDDFLKGSPENPWHQVFPEFTDAIQKHMAPGTSALLTPEFSTSGPVEQAASQIVLLAAMQSYFDYVFETRCGIPQIVLEGTPADWDMLIDRATKLGQFNLDWWIEPLTRVLGEFKAAVRNNVNEEFWRSIYKWNNASGGPYISGWITAFFPYTNDRLTQRATVRNERLIGGRLTTPAFPGGLARAPFLWEYFKLEFPMEFLGGFVGVRQHPETLWLRPEIGWAVREVDKQELAIQEKREELAKLVQSRRASGSPATGP